MDLKIHSCRDSDSEREREREREGRELQSSGYEESQYRRPLEAELNEHRQSHASSGMPYRDTHELFVPDGSGKLI